VSSFKVFLSPPDISVLEKSFVASALESGWAAPAGPDLVAFESEVAGVCNRQFGVAVSSGTAALHLALLSLEVKPGDVIICSTLTFVATANAISYVGGIPVFVDSEYDSGNMSPVLLEKSIRKVLDSGRRIAAVLPVDFLGKVANYGEILRICRAHEIPVVADAAESLGAKHHGQPAGSFGEISIVSFNGNKIATTSGGGMLLTNDERLAQKTRFLATQGREPVQHYEHRELGYNYRLSNILASLGRAQIQRLPSMIARRHAIRRAYEELFAGLDGVSIFGGDFSEDNCWLTAITVRNDLGWTTGDLSEFLAQREIESRNLWKPMHLQPLYKDCEAFLDGTAEDLFATGLALPSGSNISKDQWDLVESAVQDFLALQR
jgi:dTDP-4-amino-4,6-dideoxygalactose transaminase